MCKKPKYKNRCLAINPICKNDDNGEEILLHFKNNLQSLSKISLNIIKKKMKVNNKFYELKIKKFNFYYMNYFVFFKFFFFFFFQLIL